MGRIGAAFLQGKRLLFGKIESNDVPVNNNIPIFNFATNQWELGFAGGGGSGVQTSSNVGAGAGLALTRVLDDLPFKSIIGELNRVIITVNPTDITITLGSEVVINNQANTYTNQGLQDFNGSSLSRILNASLTGFLELANSTQPSVPTLASRFYTVDQNGSSHLKQLDSNGMEWDMLEDQLLTVRNTSGGILLKGELCYITGATGNINNIDLAQANLPATSKSVVMLKEDVPDNGFTRGLLVGNLNGVDTTGFGLGDTIYLSESIAGQFTNIIPPHPNEQQVVGHVTTVGANGSVHAFIANTVGNALGTNRNTFGIGDGLAGSKSISFVNLFTSLLAANPTAARTWTLPDDSGLLALRKNVSSILQNSANTESIGEDGDRFLALVSLSSDTSLEINRQTPFVKAVKLKNMGIFISSNTSIGIGATFTLRINGVDGNQTITIASGATGFFQDTVNEDDIAVGDLVAYRFDKDAAAGSIIVVGTGIEVFEQ